MPDLEEGEKENEGGTPVSKPKRKRKRKTASTEEPDDKKNKTGEKSNEQGTGSFSYLRKIVFFLKVIVVFFTWPLFIVVAQFVLCLLR